MLGILIIFILLLGAWGIRTVPQKKVWLPSIFKKRLLYRLTEGLVWLPRWIFDYEEFSILEEELVILGQDKNSGMDFGSETMTCSDGVTVILNKVAIFWQIVLKEEPKAGWRKILRFLGWKPGIKLFDYSQIHSQDVGNRLRVNAADALRKLVKTYSSLQLTNISLEGDGIEISAGNRIQTLESVDEISRKLIEVLQRDVERWGIIIKQAPIGDIDPNPQVQKFLEARVEAQGHKAAIMVKMEADILRVIRILELSDVSKTFENVMEAYRRIRQLDNERIGNEQLGLIAGLIRNFAEPKAASPVANTLVTT